MPKIERRCGGNLRHTEQLAQAGGYLHVLLRPIEEVIYGLPNEDRIIFAIYRKERREQETGRPKHIFVWQWCVITPEERRAIDGLREEDVKQIDRAITIATHGKVRPARGAMRVTSAFREHLENHRYDYGEDFVAKGMEEDDVRLRLEVVQDCLFMAKEQLKQPRICEGVSGVQGKIAYMKAHEGILLARIARF